MTFFGTQPTLTQVPPSLQVSSTMATCQGTGDVSYGGSDGTLVQASIARLRSLDRSSKQWYAVGGYACGEKRTTAHLGAILSRPTSGAESTTSSSDNDEVVVVLALVIGLGLERDGCHLARRKRERAEVGEVLKWCGARTAAKLCGAQG